MTNYGKNNFSPIFFESFSKKTIVIGSSQSKITISVRRTPTGHKNSKNEKNKQNNVYLQGV